MTGPRDPAAAAGDWFRVGDADRERVIETLKDAFAHGRLNKDELDARAGKALAARTYADLAALTADIPPGPPAARSARPPAPARRHPLARAAAGSGACLTIAAAAVWGAAILDPGPFARTTSGPPGFPSPSLMLIIAVYAVLAAIAFFIVGMANSSKQRRSRGQLPPRPGPGCHALDGEQGGSAGHGPVPPGPNDGQARANLASRPCRPCRYCLA